MKPKTHKICANPDCDNEFKLYKTTDKFCSPECQRKCTNQKPKKVIDWNTIKPRKPINKVSKKQKVLNAQYSVDRIQFLSKPENKICFIKGCGKSATTVEHQKGRKGFADDWARENNIPLILDKRFWKPCCLEHNLELENNPELSKEYQLSKLHQGGK
jgi:hypothetical protein